MGESVVIHIQRSVVLLPATLLLLITACAPTPRIVETIPEPKSAAPADPDNRQNSAEQSSADFQTWLAELKTEALQQGIRPEVVQEALEGQQPAPAVLKPRHKQAEFVLSKSEYVRRLASETRFREGLRQMAQHRVLLRKVAETYGVPESYLLALWAIESDFGKGGSRHSVIGALVTQAWQSQRRNFFRKQLLAALTILDQEHMPSSALRGSWAGAMGHFQFIPTTYRDYAVDFDGDGHRNIWTDVGDALASAASYLVRAGWKKDRGWGWQVSVPQGFDVSLADLKNKKSLGDWRKLGLPAVSGADDLTASLILPDGPGGQAYLVTDNFRALMRWNRSVAFGLAVGHLADRFEKTSRTAAAGRQ
ncbi:membrane-bound lytic murein transglycosylase B [Syntrophotalea carbinolica DSM 2380]|uniref:Membrane-bound lytic murein transglycosylase B n=1 Tax=Syntrophotalea carbinolica (strain DSM 2380 / NBRC 103641 / GraBd1) TaxID=338963 RepID=Q3A1T1_SYNC1|nr:membrane-bound lytic murein transglycosylase B [Syntrophotalea carbinolica DSM 2380]